MKFPPPVLLNVPPDMLTTPLPPPRPMATQLPTETDPLS
jgi:hypothetical protein